MPLFVSYNLTLYTIIISKQNKNFTADATLTYFFSVHEIVTSLRHASVCCGRLSWFYF